MWIFRNVNFVGFQIRCNLFGLNFEKGVWTVQNYDYFHVHRVDLFKLMQSTLSILRHHLVTRNSAVSAVFKTGFFEQSFLFVRFKILLLGEHVTDMRKNLLRWGDFARCLKHKCNRRVPDIMSFIEWITNLKMTLEWYWILFIFNVCGWFSCDLLEQCDRG